MNRQAATDMPDPDGEFFHSPLSNMKKMNAEQKHFNIVVTLISNMWK